MPARYTVYLKRSAAGVTPEQLLAGVCEADLHTIAESYDVPDEAIESALTQLRIENVKPPGFVHYRLCYRPGRFRPIDIERWESDDGLAAAVQEEIEGLGIEAHPLAEWVSDYLMQCADSVSISHGLAADQTMAPVLASEAARWLAGRFDGIVCGPDGEWWRLGQYGEFVSL